MVRVRPQVLATLVARIFRAQGAAPATARAVAGSLVSAHLAGHDSHGVMRIARYLEYIRSGRIVPAATPVVRHQGGATALVDGRWCFGQVGARFAGALAAELAEVQGVGVVALHNVMHIGRLGEYVEDLARAGWAALLLTSNGGPDNAVAPHGGRDRLFGTNPLAFGCPGAARGRPLVVDFATSATAEGKLALARAEGRRLEPGVLLDRSGRPSTDPASYYAGGALLPFGGHKGYGIIVMIEALARIMTGYTAPGEAGYHRRPGNAVLLLVCDPRRFVGRREFAATMRRLARAVSASRPAAGCERVRLPGEPEADQRAARQRRGIPLPPALWRELQELGGRERLRRRRPQCAR